MVLEQRNTFSSTVNVSLIESMGYRRNRLAERVGFEPLVFANSLAVNKIAATIEYNRLAYFATKSIDSTVPNA